ncbi:nucleoside triphosphatase YtkD [Anaerohalosphaera lusitana]|uniref:Nucleoside triphosphatase YtkD n=1 Tax=Anaerohalosphaera lusitana TaxID=1936003 RepID=A0A1U9NHS1_9BACT|nr:NUDIX hydrolase [Anaerohalosphaera lusitana]AQT67150.1 nucleoside triphosphatase YtkD [Anaerohalosphaera lusitana]
MKFDWFHIAKRLKAISQAGKFFAKDEYELGRHEEIEEIAAKVLERHTDLDAEEIVRLLQKDMGYPTPKVDSRGVVFRDGKVLLVKEIEDGGWTLPGGWCDVGMTPSENVVREVWEESGFLVEAKRLLAVYDRDRQGHKPEYVFDIYKMFFLCEIVGGEARTSIETSDVRFFGRDEIPELSRGRTLEHQLEKFFDMYESGEWVTDFD